MSLGANVRSVDAIKDFKVALINFAEEARIALDSSEMQIRQMRNWLQRDQLSYWQSQVKRGQERVSMARADLFRRQLSQANSDAVSDTDQKEALRDALKKLREAEEKVAIIKKWIPILDHAISEYHGQSQPLGDRLSGSFQATLGLLERTLKTLDDYLAMAPPTTRPAPPPRRPEDDASSEAGSTAASSSSSTSTAPDPEATAEYPVPAATEGKKSEPEGGMAPTEGEATALFVSPSNARVDPTSEDQS